MINTFSHFWISSSKGKQCTCEGRVYSMNPSQAYLLDKQDLTTTRNHDDTKERNEMRNLHKKEQRKECGGDNYSLNLLQYQLTPCFGIWPTTFCFICHDSWSTKGKNIIFQESRQVMKKKKKKKVRQQRIRLSKKCLKGTEKDNDMCNCFNRRKREGNHWQEWIWMMFDTIVSKYWWKEGEN